jgi:hypothetical protein
LRWRYLSLVAAISASITLIMPASLGQEILLYTQQPYNLTNNRTLVAEDVDAHAGVVWLKLYSRNQTLKSALVGIGDRFIYNNTNLTVSKIYAGGDRDLIELKINNRNNNGYYNVNGRSNDSGSPINSSERHSLLNNTKISSINASKRSPTSMKSPGLGVWAVLLLSVLGRRFIKVG